MKNTTLLFVTLLLLPFALPIGADEVCQGFGPQTPRDIDQKGGTNARIFSLAPQATQMNLCNIHFHKHAEHKAADFSIFAGGGEHGGYRCSATPSLPAPALEAPEVTGCEGIEPGDTVEVHWVHSSCDIEPGKGLGSCLSDACANPDLRVETQVFLLVNDPEALDFADFAYGGNVVNGYHQAKTLPSDTGTPVEFHGSTTGPSYDQKTCSPLQVSWSVRPRCAMLDISSLHRWCRDNVFEEDHAHGVRALVTEPSLLAPIAE
ncbi:MAG: hypothetical protein MI919_07895 [Holophagales bacterium]|nr:hypothetical protein [Holophagales bacterium]